MQGSTRRAFQKTAAGNSTTGKKCDFLSHHIPGFYAQNTNFLSITHGRCHRPFINDFGRYFLFDLLVA